MGIFSYLNPYSPTTEDSGKHHTSATMSTAQKPRIIRSITLARADNFMSDGGNGHEINLKAMLWEITEEGDKVFTKILKKSNPGLERLKFDKIATREGWVESKGVGESFGPTWSTHWLHIFITIPESLNGLPVYLTFDSNSEAMVYSPAGIPLQGLTGGGGGDSRREYLLTQKGRAGHQHELYIEIACNGLFGAGAGGNGSIQPPVPDRTFTLSTMVLRAPNVLAQKLYLAMSIVLDMAKQLPGDSQRGAEALWVVEEVCDLVRYGEKEGLEKALRIIEDYLDAPNANGGHLLTAVGHCHIDTAWLWPFAETRRKTARSWASQIRLMEKHPDYTFVCSQAQQYKWLMQDYPELFEEVSGWIKKMQFLPVGGTWVEMDCNIPSGESLCRQFLLGQSFFHKHFGYHSNVFWLPDTFGYSAQLPQIVRQCNMKYFFTQKLSWNNINSFPKTTFEWTGLDGSRVLTHMCPSNTYTGSANVGELLMSERNHKDKDFSNESLLVYGVGDGGGGPLPAMVERLEKMQDVAPLPKVKMGNVEEFYERLEKNSKELSRWKGELYFELHRGTYTSTAAVKKFNRKIEFLLREIELLGAIASQSPVSSYTYPANLIESLWEDLCLCQFHDVLPGSSIELVNIDARRILGEVQEKSTKLRKELLDRVWGFKAGDEMMEVTGVKVFNSLPWSRTDIVKVPSEGIESRLAQLSEDGKQGYVIVADAPSMGVMNVSADRFQSLAADWEASAKKSADGGYVLSNRYLEATFDKQGQLVSLYDKENDRESIPSQAKGNVFQMYEDVPLYWDAWDVEIYHLSKGRNVENGTVKLIEDGPMVVSLLVEKQISKTSSLRQVISLTSVGKRVDFDTELEWNENRQFLKVEFVWDILADTATYDTQFGVISRPTHTNTSWEAAKFEVCGHKFADLSEYGYGVALLNDCKYGYATNGNTMRLSLVRSPKAPDTHLDIGHHSFKYAVYPHKGHFLNSEVVREAYAFNVPLLAKASPHNGDTQSALAAGQPAFEFTGAENVVLETVKRAQDGDGMVLRLFEAYGGKAVGALKSAYRIKSIYRCSILEEDGDKVELSSQNETELILKPFEIMTLKVRLE